MDDFSLGAQMVRILFDGLPASFNVLGMRSNGWAIDAEKKRLQQLIRVNLSGVTGSVVEERKIGTKHMMVEIPVARWGDLPEVCDVITVEGRLTFPDRKGRDADNFQTILAKACGDALQEGGWLTNDTFYPVFKYQFGALTGIYEKGVERTELMFFPIAPALHPRIDVSAFQ